MPPDVLPVGGDRQQAARLADRARTAQAVAEAADAVVGAEAPALNVSKSSAVTRVHCGPGSVGTAERALSSDRRGGRGGDRDTVPGSARRGRRWSAGAEPVPWRRSREDEGRCRAHGSRRARTRPSSTRPPVAPAERGAPGACPDGTGTRLSPRTTPPGRFAAARHTEAAQRLATPRHRLTLRDPRPAPWAGQAVRTGQRSQSGPTRATNTAPDVSAAQVRTTCCQRATSAASSGGCTGSLPGRRAGRRRTPAAPRPGRAPADQRAERAERRRELVERELRVLGRRAGADRGAAGLDVDDDGPPLRVDLQPVDPAAQPQPGTPAAPPRRAAHLHRRPGRAAPAARPRPAAGPRPGWRAPSRRTRRACRAPGRARGGRTTGARVEPRPGRAQRRDPARRVAAPAASAWTRACTNGPVTAASAPASLPPCRSNTQRSGQRMIFSTSEGDTGTTSPAGRSGVSVGHGAAPYQSSGWAPGMPASASRASCGRGAGARGPGAARVRPVGRAGGPAQLADQLGQHSARPGRCTGRSARSAGSGSSSSRKREGCSSSPWTALTSRVCRARVQAT